MNHHKNTNKIIIALLIFSLVLLLSPTLSADVEWKSRSFGASVTIQGIANVTTNASTNVSYNSSILNGYLLDDGGLNTTIGFEWGETIVYNNNITINKTSFIYYFDGYSVSEVWALHPQNMANGDINTYAGTSTNGDVELLDNNTCSGINLGSITKVEVRIYAGTPSGPVSLFLRPVFTLGDGNNHQKILTTTYGWSSWSDITNDPNAPGIWTWSDVKNLDMDVQSNTGNSIQASKVEISVSVNYLNFQYNLTNLLPDTTYHYRAFAMNELGTVYGSDMTFKTLNPLSVNTKVGFLQTTTATIGGAILSDLGESTTCGFWVGSSTTNKTSFEQNVTCTGTYNSGEAFSKALTGLTSGEYYYFRSWMLNSHGFYNSTNESYFITRPNNPSGLIAVNSSFQQIGLRWTNATVGSGSNLTTVIVYKTTGYPTSVTDGTIGYNGTSNNTLITDLAVDETYYFSAWHYVNGSGSPLLGAFSSGYATASGSTAGGIYNITIRYEDNLTLVAATTMANLEHTCTGRLRTGQLLNITFPNINPFPMNFTTRPNVFFFDFKNLTLRRAITPETGERNITFYVSDRPEYETGLNETECQLLYTFSFEDMTNYFRVSNQSKLYVYKFNGSEKFYIHQDYWSAEGTVDVPLQYGERYYIGVWCPLLYIPLVQYFDALDTTAPVIFISETLSTNESIYKYVSINFSWDRGGNGLWVNYTDSSFNTNSFTITIYQIWHTNSTRLLRNTTTWSLNQKDFHWTLTDGCNNSKSYYVTVEIDHKLFTTNQTMSSLYFPQISAITNPAWINDWFNLILGDSPFVDTDPDSSTYDQFVPWTHIIAFGVCLLLLMTIGHINMELSMIGVGFLLVILEVLLGVVITRDVGLTTVGVLGGVLLILLGFIMALGGGSKQR